MKLTFTLPPQKNIWPILQTGSSVEVRQIDNLAIYEGIADQYLTKITSIK